jgi:hypothetical protein
MQDVAGQNRACIGFPFKLRHEDWKLARGLTDFGDLAVEGKLQKNICNAINVPKK